MPMLTNEDLLTGIHGCAHGEHEYTQVHACTVKKRVLPQHLLGCSYACLNTTPLGCYIGCCECTHRVL